MNGQWKKLKFIIVYLLPTKFDSYLLLILFMIIRKGTSQSLRFMLSLNFTPRVKLHDFVGTLKFFKSSAITHSKYINCLEQVSSAYQTVWKWKYNSRT